MFMKREAYVGMDHCPSCKDLSHLVLNHETKRSLRHGSKYHRGTLECQVCGKRIPIEDDMIEGYIRLSKTLPPLHVAQSLWADVGRVYRDALDSIVHQNQTVDS